MKAEKGIIMEKYYTLVETCVDAEDKNTAIEKTENVLRGKPKGVEYEASVVLNADTTHKAYLQYLSRWIFEHYEDEFEGCSPACFDEWLDNEGTEDEDIPDWRVSEGEYELTDDGDVILGKEAAFNFKIGDYKRIEFLDDFGDTERIGIYRVIDKSNGKVFCEFIS